MFKALCYNVMIVSPSDIADERNIIKDAIYRWNEINSKKRNIVFLASGWDTNVHPDSGCHPQASINQQILKEADFIIAVFGNKIGSPTAEYPSGSVEEIMRHMESGKKALIYFSKMPVPREQLDMEQIQRLNAFKKVIQNTVYFKEYLTLDELKSMIRDDIQLISNELDSPSEIQETDRSFSRLALSDRERHILKLMRGRGNGSLQWVPVLGGWLLNDHEIRDVRQVAEIKSAIKSLTENHLIERKGIGKTFFLTSEGYDVSDFL